MLPQLLLANRLCRRLVGRRRQRSQKHEPIVGDRAKIAPKMADD